jgi:hypothetical protein
MYASIRRYQTAANQDLAALAREAEQGFLPIISAVPGLRGYYLVDTGGGSFVTISLFDDEAAARASAQQAASWVQANMASAIQGAPEVATGKALISHPG